MLAVQLLSWGMVIAAALRYTLSTSMEAPPPWNGDAQWRQTMSNHQISDSFGVFVCFMSMLGRFRSISSNLGFHAAEGITANLCDANTNWVAQLQIFPPKPKGQRSDRPIDGQHLALNPALLHFRSAPTVLHHQRQDLGQKMAIEGIDLLVPTILVRPIFQGLREYPQKIWP